ncbi:MAG: hypothetical protein JNL66_11565 [Alphaproteobacteria bacterium]|nr:hypothetical protein [Alphaproteobacteria bacterium]
MTIRLSAIVLAATLGACGYPDPNAYPSTDRFVGLSARVHGAPQAPEQTVYCYRNLGRAADCTTQPQSGQDYRLVNAFVAAPPPPGQTSTAPQSTNPQFMPAQPQPSAASMVAPPPPARQAQVAPPAGAPAGAAPLRLRPQGPAVGPAASDDGQPLPGDAPAASQ